MTRPARWPLFLLPIALLLQWLASLAPAVVEAVYARGLYRGVRRVLALLTGWVPFSVAECALAALLAALAWRLAARIRRGAWRAWWRRDGFARRMAHLGRGVLALSGGVYLTFLLCWGLNYQRPSLATLAGLGSPGGTRDELRALSAELIGSANALRANVGDDAAGVMRLPAGQRAALDAADDGLTRASARLPLLAGPRVRAKRPLCSPVLSRLGIAGIFVPFTGEAHVNATLPDPDLPFSASHELAHARGLAREDEANYAAALACRLHERPEFRYSGALLSSLYVQAALATVDPRAAAALEGTRTDAVGRDVRALAEWSRRYRSRLTDVTERVNDTYLKSQGQELGVRSYGGLVDLLLAEKRTQAGGGLGGASAPPRN